MSNSSIIVIWYLQSYPSPCSKNLIIWQPCKIWRKVTVKTKGVAPNYTTGIHKVDPIVLFWTFKLHRVTGWFSLSKKVPIQSLCCDTCTKFRPTPLPTFYLVTSKLWCFKFFRNNPCPIYLAMPGWQIISTLCVEIIPYLLTGGTFSLSSSTRGWVVIIMGSSSVTKL